jgi:vanillate O-demethylase monooxygenase subunit
MSYTTDPNWSAVLGYYQVNTNWVLIRENVMDLTHIAYLHKTTFRQNDWTSPPEVTMDGDTVVYRQDFPLGPLSPLFCHAMGLSETKPIKRFQEGRMPSLAISFSDWNVHDPDPEPGARTDFLMRGCHIVTPAQRGQTHYYWAAAFDIPDVSPDLCERTKRSVTEAFDEDKALLEKMYGIVSQDPRGTDYPEMSRAGDAAGARVRMVLQKKLKSERG